MSISVTHDSRARIDLNAAAGPGLVLGAAAGLLLARGKPVGPGSIAMVVGAGTAGTLFGLANGAAWNGSGNYRTSYDWNTGEETISTDARRAPDTQLWLMGSGALMGAGAGVLAATGFGKGVLGVAGAAVLGALGGSAIMGGFGNVTG